MTLSFTLLESLEPAVLAKRFSINQANGTLVKQSAAKMTRGTSKTVTVESLDEFLSLLEGLTSAQALAYGIAVAHPEAKIVSNSKRSVNPGTISRTREFFQFAPKPGLMFFDHDGHPDGPITPADLHARLVKAVPALADVRMLWRPSASSCVGGPNEPFTELKGQRLYLAVCDASLIPAAAKQIIDLLWASGEGWVQPSACGRALQRTLIDGSVFQPERMDFAGPPDLGEGITRTPPAAQTFGQNAEPFDLRLIVADSAVQKRAADARRLSRDAMKADLSAITEQWLSKQAPKLAGARGITEDAARGVLSNAVSNLFLEPDFELVAEDGSVVTVGDLLARPTYYHGRRFADPLEPDYGNDKRIAWVNLKSGGRPFIHSYAHGGLTYWLVRPTAEIELRAGERARGVDDALLAMGQRGEVYDFGDNAMARISDGRAVAVTRDWLTDHCDRTMRFYRMRVDAVTQEQKKQPVDTPAFVAKSIMSKAGERNLNKLNAIISAPTLRADGAVLDEPGYDPFSKLLYVTQERDHPRVPAAPSIDEAIAALRDLWRPVSQFPFVDATSNAVMLQAMLTATLRASLPSAPGVAFDAPTAGSGKTLLGKIIGILATGEAPPVLPPVTDRDEEARKRLFATLRDGHRVLLWDNVRDPLGGPALDAFLTAPMFADRVLGTSETVVLPNRSLFIATGNNITLVGDTCRRIMVARIDASCERPYTREFQFDPEQMVLGQRQRLVVAALTIIRAWITAGRPRTGGGRTGSFEAWDDLVRQPVLFIAQAAKAYVDLPEFGDPADAFQRAYAFDAESTKLSGLMTAWHDVFGSRAVSVNDAIKAAASNEALESAIIEIAERNGVVNRRVLGRWFQSNVGRRVVGLRIERGLLLNGNVRWSVQSDIMTKLPPETHPHPPHPLEDEVANIVENCDQVGSVASGGFETSQMPATSDGASMMGT